jgi:glutamate N-acetyltransferase/amino-acid N-acetyltransferase
MSALPKGFRLSVASAGIKEPGRPDMALLSCDGEGAAAGTFTTNRVKAAPVKLTMKRLRTGRLGAVVVNSGNANACTGARGMRDAEETAFLVAGGLGVPENRVAVCSTGVIGVPLPMSRIRPALASLTGGLGTASLRDAAEAIMTTDTFPKFISRKVRVGGRQGVISAIAKGAGMIEPSMATMLCFVMTDVAVESGALKAGLREAVEGSFNRITVDGHRSTNDTVLALSGGGLGNRPLREGAPGYAAFRKALSDVCRELSELIVRDGEGATKLVEVVVTGARTDDEAKRGARAVANSLLVKTALYGNDPNWGRIVSILGASGIQVREDGMDVSFGRVKVVAGGVATGRSGARELRKKRVTVKAGLGVGKGSARVLTCDLTEEYVRINAEYTT